MQVHHPAHDLPVLLFLRLLELRREIQEAHVVENWNSANDFILIGKGGDIAAHRQEDQEVMMLALHLLQNAMVYINTLMIQRVLSEPAWMGRLDARGLPRPHAPPRRVLSPYGTFVLDMTSRLDIESPVVIFPTGDEGRRKAISTSSRAPHRTNNRAQQLTLFNPIP